MKLMTSLIARRGTRIPAELLVYVFTKFNSRLKQPTIRVPGIVGEDAAAVRALVVLPKQPQRWKWRVSITHNEKGARVVVCMRYARTATLTRKGTPIEAEGVTILHDFEEAWELWCLYARML